MTNTRTIKELLTVMLENKHLFRLGLCLWVTDLEKCEYITFAEAGVIKDYIRSNEPITVHTIANKIFERPNFYWKMGNIKPRIRYIKRHIKKNS